MRFLINFRDKSIFGVLGAIIHYIGIPDTFDSTLNLFSRKTVWNKNRIKKILQITFGSDILLIVVTEIPRFLACLGGWAMASIIWIFLWTFSFGLCWLTISDNSLVESFLEADFGPANSWFLISTPPPGSLDSLGFSRAFSGLWINWFGI